MVVARNLFGALSCVAGMENCGCGASAQLIANAWHESASADGRLADNSLAVAWVNPRRTRGVAASVFDVIKHLTRDVVGCDA
jgi:hypothetical protein